MKVQFNIQRRFRNIGFHFTTREVESHTEPKPLGSYVARQPHGKHLYSHKSGFNAAIMVMDNGDARVDWRRDKK